MATPPLPPLVVISGYDTEAHTYELDAQRGVLTPLCKSTLGTNPSYCVIRGDRAYAVSETASGRVAAFSFDAATGAFHSINTSSAEGDDPCHVSLSASGRWVLVSNYSSRGLTVLPADRTAGLGAAATVLEPGRHCHQAVVVGQTVYVPFLGSDAVFVYTLNEADGSLAPHAISPRVALAGGSGPRHIALDAARSAAYILNELDMTLSVARYDASTGALGASPFASYPTLPEGQSKQGCSTAHVVVSSDGRFVYASNRCGEAPSSIAVFAVSVGGASGATEALSAVAWTAPGEVHTPRDFALTPDGAFLICANQGTHDATVFQRDGATGGLRKVSSVVTGSKPCFVGVIDRA